MGRFAVLSVVLCLITIEKNCLLSLSRVQVSVEFLLLASYVPYITCQVWFLVVSVRVFVFFVELLFSSMLEVHSFHCKSYANLHAVAEYLNML